MPCGTLLRMLRRTPRLLLLPAVIVAGGCGSASTTPSSRTVSTAGTSTSESGGALAADARSAATGDIPDSQNFLTLNAPQLRISILYPEGWTVKESAAALTIKEKNNLVRIAVSPGPTPTAASTQAQLAALGRSTPGLTAGPVKPISLKNGPAFKVTYTTRSAPNPVTGKQVTLTVDRYALAHSGRVATVDLGTPVGVDNVDAYKRMIESFTWR